MRLLAHISCLIFLSGAAFGQSEEPAKFEVADIHPSPPGSRLYSNGPYLRGTRYEVRTASIVDLIQMAYSIPEDKILGGPSWLELDRFDILAKVPAGAKADDLKVMLQNLLADRFHLTTHNDTKSFPAFTLTAGDKPKLKESDGSAQPGCQSRSQAAQAAAAGGPLREISVTATCHSTTMASFVNMLRGLMMITNETTPPEVVDTTDLKGIWDFDFKFTLSLESGPAAGADNLFDAVDKQLGLKLTPTRKALPVIVVDSVNRRPTENPPDADKSFPPLPVEFEVAEIKPGTPLPTPVPGQPMRRTPAYQNDRVYLQNTTLKNLIRTAWNITSDDMLIGAPKWLENDHFDFIAKVPAAVAPSATGVGRSVDLELYRPMFRTFLMDHFKMAVHFEERPGNMYVLTAAKPKMQKADPANRTRCFDGPGADGKDPRKSNPQWNRLVTCQNVTMADLAKLLPDFASGYFDRPNVLDNSGLEVSFDFTLNFSGAGMVNGSARNSVAAGSSETNAAADPTGGLSLFDAMIKQLGLKLETQKRPLQVLVIDHIEQKPIEN